MVIIRLTQVVIFKIITNNTSQQHDVKKNRTLFAFVEEEFVLVCAQQSHPTPCYNFLGAFEVKQFDLRWFHGDEQGIFK